MLISLPSMEGKQNCFQGQLWPQGVPLLGEAMASVFLSRLQRKRFQLSISSQAPASCPFCYIVTLNNFWFVIMLWLWAPGAKPFTSIQGFDCTTDLLHSSLCLEPGMEMLGPSWLGYSILMSLWCLNRVSKLSSYSLNDAKTTFTTVSRLLGLSWVW